MCSYYLCLKIAVINYLSRINYVYNNYTVNQQLRKYTQSEKISVEIRANSEPTVYYDGSRRAEHAANFSLNAGVNKDQLIEEVDCEVCCVV